MLGAICCYYLYTRRLRLAGEPKLAYNIAVRNSDFFDLEKDAKCMNCHLIEMGSMACYQELCPECGKPPPK